MAALEPYYFASNVVRLRNDNIEDGEVKKSLGEKDIKSAAGFSPCRQFRVGPNDVR